MRAIRRSSRRCRRSWASGRTDAVVWSRMRTASPSHWARRRRSIYGPMTGVVGESPVGGELTATAEPAALVPGDPAELDALAAVMGTFALGMGESAGRLRSISAGEWVGSGGDAFRGLIGSQPSRFGRASDAFGQARAAVVSYAVALRQAQ